jgi:hypothetical protein
VPRNFFRSVDRLSGSEVCGHYVLAVLPHLKLHHFLYCMKVQGYGRVARVIICIVILDILCFCYSGQSGGVFYPLGLVMFWTFSGGSRALSGHLVVRVIGKSWQYLSQPGVGVCGGFLSPPFL